MSGYGGRWDAWRKWLDHDRKLRGLEGYGDLFFQDATSGDDEHEGTDPSAPLQTLLEAIDRVTDNNNDIIIHKGLENLAASIEFDKTKTTLLGWAGRGANPHFPEHGSIYRSVAEDLPVLDISADFVEIAGIALAGEWVTDSVAGQGALGVRSGANKAYIHNCLFTDWGYASNTAGITLSGPHYTVIEDCEFHGVWANMDAGIYVGHNWTGSGTGQPAYTRIKRCNFMGQGTGGSAMTYGIMHDPGSIHQNFVYEDCKFGNVTYALEIGQGAYLWGVVTGFKGTMAKADIFESFDVANDTTIAYLSASWRTTVADCWGSDGPLTA